MKYLKLFEDIKDIDPYDEEEWDEKEDFSKQDSILKKAKYWFNYLPKKYLQLADDYDIGWENLNDYIYNIIDLEVDRGTDEEIADSISTTLREIVERSIHLWNTNKSEYEYFICNGYKDFTLGGVNESVDIDWDNIDEEEMNEESDTMDDIRNIDLDFYNFLKQEDALGEFAKNFDNSPWHKGDFIEYANSIRDRYDYINDAFPWDDVPRYKDEYFWEDLDVAWNNYQYNNGGEREITESIQWEFDDEEYAPMDNMDDLFLNNKFINNDINTEMVFKVKKEDWDSFSRFCNKHDIRWDIRKVNTLKKDSMGKRNWNRGYFYLFITLYKNKYVLSYVHPDDISEFGGNTEKKIIEAPFFINESVDINWEDFDEEEIDPNFKDNGAGFYLSMYTDGAEVEYNIMEVEVDTFLSKGGMVRGYLYHNDIKTEENYIYDVDRLKSGYFNFGDEVVIYLSDNYPTETDFNKKIDKINKGIDNFRNKGIRCPEFNYNQIK